MSWSRWIDRRLPLFAAAAYLVFVATAAAQEKPACEGFKWPLAIEKSWFEADSLADLASGATVPSLKEGAFTLTLRPSAEVAFVLVPEGKPKPGKPFGALVTFDRIETPGLYQVSLSDEAWIDVVQAGKYRPSLDFTGVHGCRGLRKSVRFELLGGPMVLQLSSAGQASLKLAIRPAR